VLSGPNETSGTGAAVLSMTNRAALLDGRLVLSAAVAGSPPAEVAVRIPRR
jgi:hypothetical protein